MWNLGTHHVTLGEKLRTQTVTLKSKAALSCNVQFQLEARCQQAACQWD